MSTNLPLRDVHLPPAPSLWPPAPGWWAVAAVVLLLLAIPLLLRARRLRRERAWQRQFDAELAAAGTGAARVAALLVLLRRAARQQRPGDEVLQGDAWLQVVDPTGSLSPPQKALLLQGAYQPLVDPQQLAALEPWARTRYVSLLKEGAR
ncbi:DUF4381 domain-containing protein [Stenotrophomonas sp. CFBP 13718]|uniref:DUF4381 domain-containing protein n=1 Tax=Stenotrophomonas sp. CFBP 13718 TaxID=2775304 RepID=UPI00177AF611|nr:DUF4381 domain-containing protein [Stenotrophomonas sp. CFBP 13718]MBD8695406.1 DUF4381 domain-containing protein [Stenotrophomonas sp. CFBP 13718]